MFNLKGESELTEYLIQETDKVLEAHDNDSSQLVGILLDIQNAMEFRYIPQPVAEYLSKKLCIPSTRVFDVISFYTSIHDKPRAKYPIEICDSIVCKVNDSETLQDTLERILGVKVGETTQDGKFVIEKVPCFGACDIGPAVRINGEVFGKLNDEQLVRDLLKKFA